MRGAYVLASRSASRSLGRKSGELKRPTGCSSSSSIMRPISVIRCMSPPASQGEEIVELQFPHNIWAYSCRGLTRSSNILLLLQSTLTCYCIGSKEICSFAVPYKGLHREMQGCLLWYFWNSCMKCLEKICESPSEGALVLSGQSIPRTPLKGTNTCFARLTISKGLQHALFALQQSNALDSNQKLSIMTLRTRREVASIWGMSYSCFESCFLQANSHWFGELNLAFFKQINTVLVSLP